MKTKWLKRMGALGLCLGATVIAQAQPFGGFGGGGFGGGGGGGGQNQNRGTAGATSYNAAGAVGNATISMDPDTHNLTIIADSNTTAYISEVVSNLDRPQPQVLIKVVFLEVMHNDSLDLGIEGSYNAGKSSKISGYLTNFMVITNFMTSTGNSNLLVSGTSVVPKSVIPINGSAVGGNNFNLAGMQPPAGLYSILGSDFQATLRAIAQAGKAQLLSRPSILARNNQPATIVVGQQVPLITSVRYDTFGNAVNSVTYQNVGIILKVTPFITSEGLVEMIVQPQTSSIDNTVSVPISAGVNAPVIDTRSADTVVTTPDGQTVVIGGLMRNEKSQAVSKIPFLGDIPILGNLFKHKMDSNSKSELLIFLTPHVIGTPTQLAGLSDREKDHMLMPKSYSEEELDRFLEKVPTKKPDAKSSSPKRH
jgi:general secretion pathway protein D